MTREEFASLVKRARSGDEVAARELRGYADRALGPSGATVRDGRAVVHPSTSTRRRLSLADLRAKARLVAERLSA